MLSDIKVLNVSESDTRKCKINENHRNMMFMSESETDAQVLNTDKKMTSKRISFKWGYEYWTWYIQKIN